MNSDVLVKITGVQDYEGIDNEFEPVEVTSVGNYVFENGRHFITYDESYDEDVMKVATRNLDLCVEDSHILADIDYSLSMNGEHLADCHVNMDIIDRASPANCGI